MTEFLLHALMVTGIAGIAAGWAWLLLREARRRDRRQDRAAAAALLDHLRRGLAGNLTGGRLRRAAREAHGSVFWTALESLGLTLSRSQQRALGEMLDDVPHVRRERRALLEEAPWRSELAARRLALLHGPLNRRALRGALRTAPRLVAMASARALARRRDRQALRWLLAHPERLEPCSPRSLAALFRSFGRGACPELMRRLEQGVSGAVTECAILSVLGVFRFLPARELCAERLGSQNLEIRIAAIRSLAGIRPAPHAEAVVALLQDPAWQVRAQAARALGLMGTVAAVPDLARSTRDRAWWVRRHAAYALDLLGDPGRDALVEIRDQSVDLYAREMADEVLRGGFLRQA